MAKRRRRSITLEIRDGFIGIPSDFKRDVKKCLSDAKKSAREFPGVPKDFSREAHKCINEIKEATNTSPFNTFNRSIRRKKKR